MPMKTVKNIIDDFKAKLNGSYGEREVMQFVYILFNEYLSWSKTQVNYAWNEEITENHLILFNTALADLVKNKPIQYILGKTWFNKHEYVVSSDVLIPRPETEELCQLIQNENIHRQYQEFSILDIGTGSGIIAIDLKLRFPYAKVKAVDISTQALSIARRNAEKNNCIIDFQYFDILAQPPASGSEKIDLIVSNPPYVLESERNLMHPNVFCFEPLLALFVPDYNPLVFYHAITAFALTNLSRPGNLYFEINERFGKELRLFLLGKGFEKIEVIKDIQGKDRFIKADLKPALDDTSYWYAEKA
jgi:release factor glutamine methyltransferase